MFDTSVFESVLQKILKSAIMPDNGVLASVRCPNIRMDFPFLAKTFEVGGHVLIVVLSPFIVTSISFSKHTHKCIHSLVFICSLYLKKHLSY